MSAWNVAGHVGFEPYSPRFGDEWFTGLTKWPRVEPRRFELRLSGANRLLYQIELRPQSAQ